MNRVCVSPPNLSLNQIQSAKRLVEDAIGVIRETVPADALIVLAGHSLGGALAVRIADTRQVNSVGVCVLDVVEGTAVSALAHMPAFLRKRPNAFGSVEDAIGYITSTGTLHSKEAAQVSIPSQLRFDPNRNQYVWRTDLVKSQPFWLSWYEGLTTMFLGLQDCAKLLVLASPDRLDKDLLIYQMQGKFQVEIITGSHSIQEDSWERLSVLLKNFAIRNRLSEIAALNAKLTAKKTRF